MTCMDHSKIIAKIVAVDVQRGDFVLCKSVEHSLHAGEIYHLIGENGLGKTTLLSQLAGLLPINQGVFDFYSCKPMVYISHQLGISSHLSVYQNLRFLLSLYNVSCTDEILDEALDFVGLNGLGDVSSAQLSAGQMRRIGLAKLFVLTPKQTPLWLLDEPFTALDVEMSGRLQDRLQQFVADGGAILMTSHQPMAVANSVLDLSEFAL